MTVPPRKATSTPAPGPARGLGRADVGAHGDVHADVARGGREHGADQEADGHLPAEVADRCRRSGAAPQDDRDDRDGAVLAVEVGGRALLDGRWISRMRSLPGPACSTHGSGRARRARRATPHTRAKSTLCSARKLAIGVQAPIRKKRPELPTRAAEEKATRDATNVPGRPPRSTTRRMKRVPAAEAAATLVQATRSGCDDTPASAPQTRAPARARGTRRPAAARTAGSPPAAAPAAARCSREHLDHRPRSPAGADGSSCTPTS